MSKYIETPLVVQCPNCGSEYMHHDIITAYERREDAKETAVTTIGHLAVHTRVVESCRDNPSMRRHGLTIQFSCEICSAISKLAFAQHKGVTNVHWEWQS